MIKRYYNGAYEYFVICQKMPRHLMNIFPMADDATGCNRGYKVSDLYYSGLNRGKTHTHSQHTHTQPHSQVHPHTHTHAYTHTHTNTRTHEHTHTHSHTHTHTHKLTHTHTYTCTHSHTHTHTHTHVHTHTHTYTCTHPHTHPHTHTFTQPHTHAHTHTHTPWPLSLRPWPTNADHFNLHRSLYFHILHKPLIDIILDGEGVKCPLRCSQKRNRNRNEHGPLLEANF